MLSDLPLSSRAPTSLGRFRSRDKLTMTRPARKRTSKKTILSVDVGGTHVKVMTNRGRSKREFSSGPHLSAKKMVTEVKRLTSDWSYDVVSVGYPGPVAHNRPLAEPHNLGHGRGSQPEQSAIQRGSSYRPPHDFTE